MNFDKYEEQITKKIEDEINKRLEKQDLSIEEVKFFLDVLSSNKIKKMANIF